MAARHKEDYERKLGYGDSSLFGKHPQNNWSNQFDTIIVAICITLALTFGKRDTRM